MSQFDLYINTDKDSNKTYPFFVDVQNGLLDTLNTRLVIPLTPILKADKTFPDHLCPPITIQGKQYALLTHQMTSISTAYLKKKEASLLSSRDKIIAAIDFLITGI